jgi:hypothetical protein
MELRKKLCLYWLAALVLGVPIAWGQSFGDQVIGEAVSCRGPNKYDIGGSPGNYQIHGSITAPACQGYGKATASSSATIGSPTASAKVIATKGTLFGASSDAAAEATDLAVLTPPSGWSGSVPVTLKTVYDFGITGVGPSTSANYGINWAVTSGGVTKVNHTVEANFNVKGEQKPSFNFVIDQVNNAYEFTLVVSGAASAVSSQSGGATAHFVTFPITLVLPQGWTCTWLSSGGAC